MEMNLEAFLRRNFGLDGEYLSDEFKAANAIPNQAERDAAVFAILDEKGPEGLYSVEAWAAWERALAMVDDLEAMGIVSESVAGDIRCGFCDNQ